MQTFVRPVTLGDPLFRNELKIALSLIATLTCLSGSGSTIASSQQATHSFTVVDEIGLALLDDEAQPVRFSSDGNYFAVYGERGRLDLNRVEDSLRFYRSQD